MYHILIVGCGLGGLAAAIAIRKGGHDVTILEKMAVLQELGAGINVSPNATSLFREWGILDDVMKRATVPCAAYMRSYRDSTKLSTQQLASAIEDVYSAPYIVLHRADLHTILLGKAQSLGVFVKLDCQITKIDFSKPSIELSNGEKHTADIIIGADGEKSFCREALLGPKLLLSKDSGDHVFRITVKTSDVIRHETLADLVQPSCINLWVGPGAHAMAYALKRDDLLNIVLTCTHDHTYPIQYGPEIAEISEAREAFEQWDQKFQTLLSLAQDCGKWTLFDTPEPASWTHSDGKFALLGDSAHAMLPFLGQGAAMAFEDAGFLGTLLSKAQTKLQLTDILSIYEHARKPRTLVLRSRSHAMRDICAFDDGPLQQERDRQLKNHRPFDGFPNFLADPKFQNMLFGYNAILEAEKAWEVYMKGEWPLLRGYWNVKDKVYQRETYMQID